MLFLDFYVVLSYVFDESNSASLNPMYNQNKTAYDFYIKYGFKPIEQKMHLKIITR